MSSPKSRSYSEGGGGSFQLRDQRANGCQCHCRLMTVSPCMAAVDVAQQGLNKTVKKLTLFSEVINGIMVASRL